MVEIRIVAAVRQSVKYLLYRSPASGVHLPAPGNIPGQVFGKCTNVHGEFTVAAPAMGIDGWIGVADQIDSFHRENIGVFAFILPQSNPFLLNR